MLKKEPSKSKVNRSAGLFIFGDVAEWFMAPDLKSARRLAPSVGSNPTVSANKRPGESGNFHRGNLTTQPKATRYDKRTIRLRCVDFNRRVHNDMPRLPITCT